MASSTDIARTYRVVTARVGPDAQLSDPVLAGTYFGPEAGDGADFREFVNLRWAQAQARGCEFMLITRVVEDPDRYAPSDAAGELARQMARENYAAAARILDGAEAHAWAAPLEAVAEFMCMRVGGVHVTVRYWLPRDAQITATLLGARA